MGGCETHRHERSHYVGSSDGENDRPFIRILNDKHMSVQHKEPFSIQDTGGDGNQYKELFIVVSGIISQPTSHQVTLVKNTPLDYWIVEKCHAKQISVQTDK